MVLNFDLIARYPVSIKYRPEFQSEIVTEQGVKKSIPELDFLYIPNMEMNFDLRA